MDKRFDFETRLKHVDVLPSTALYDGLRLLYPAKDVFIQFTSLL